MATAARHICFQSLIPYRIYEHAPPIHGREIRKPRSKKKRIQSKWTDDPHNGVDVNVVHLEDSSKPFTHPQVISNWHNSFWTADIIPFIGA